MPLIRDAAIVLGRLDYSETSQILVLFTREHGKVRAIAKGAKRSTKTRFSPGIDLLEIGAAVVSSRGERPEGLATLTEWKQTQPLLGLREKLTRIHAAQYAAELTSRLTEEWDPHAQLFDKLISLLKDLSASDNSLSLIVAYLLDLLDQVGSLPRFDACVTCGREDRLTHFSSFEGGLICRNCEPGRVEKWEVSPAAVAALRRTQADPGGPIDASATPTLFSILNYHVSHLMGMEPKTAELVLPRQKRRLY